MEVFNIKNLSFTYSNGKKALNDISLNINQGEIVCLCGPSGCGKTTLLKMLKPALSPCGDVSGSIEFFGTHISQLSERHQASRVGYVSQDIENQIVTDKVWHELAFGLESLGYDSDEIRKKVAEMATFFGIDEWFHKKTTELSGGQKQILNLASVMVMQPEMLILDEPTSQLDPIAAGEFLKTVDKINKEFGTTVILSEHKLEEVFSVADRIVVMDEGMVISDGTPQEVSKELKEKRHSMYDALPTPIRVYSAIEENGELPPLTVREGRLWLEKYAHTNQPDTSLIPTDSDNKSDTCIELKNVWFRYEKNTPDVLKGLNLDIGKNEIFGVLGGNGSGKTTTLSLISGLNTPYRGEVRIDGKKIKDIKNLYTEIIGVLPQDPKILFTKKTVYAELAEMEQDEEKIMEYAHLCNIVQCLDSHPYDLSGGEQQRAALCRVLMKNPRILLLDEPTKGFDAHFKIEFVDILRQLKNQGKTVIMVSHDVEFCAKVCDRCCMIFDGGATANAAPREFFSRNHFYTTVANRMARTVIDNAVTDDDIILAFGRKLPPKEVKEKKEYTQKELSAQKNSTPEKKTHFSLRVLVAVLFSLVAVPLTIYAGMTLLNDERYYLVSLLIIAETFVPFLTAFEDRKPRARELVILAVMCAIAVAGRVVFAPISQVKPMLAIVIISGMCLGAQTGFMVGAVSAFVSNFFFGQGPWTPWQMFAFAIVGFFAGAIFAKCSKSKTSICIYGFVSSMILYSGLVNLSSILLMKMPLNWQSIIYVYSAGLPYDLIHAVSTTVFLWLIAIPMTEKIERIKLKYQII